MFEKELSLIHEYISDLDNTPIFGSLSEDKRISYRKFAAEEIEGKLLEEELDVPVAIKDRMPFTAGEIVDDYISDLKKFVASAPNADVKYVLNEMLISCKAILNAFANGGVGYKDEVYRCQDVFTGRYFYSNLERINRALNKTNETLYEQGSVSLNAYYINLGISPIKIGYNFDWSYPECSHISLTLDNLVNDDGVRCMYVDFERYPKQNYEVWG